MSSSSSGKNRKIASSMVLHRGRLLRNPIIEIDPSGEIISVDFVEDGAMDSSPHTEFYSGIMLAGLVNAHSHLELSYLRGAIDPGTGFGNFASQIGRVRNNYTAEQRERAIIEANAKMAQEGVAAVGDIVNGNSSFGVKGRSDIEYRNFAELFGLNTPNTKAVEHLTQYPNCSITPHSTYSLNDRLFREIAHNGSAPLSIHFMESPSERELYEGCGALHDWYSKVGFKCDFLHYGSPAKRIVESVPRDRSVILVHNCCITQVDIDTIMSHFTAEIYWAVCPRSNRYISNLLPPIELLRQNGANICIGTDSLASNWSPSMLEEIREIDNAPLCERLDWATRIGAQALNMPQLGEIEVGRRPKINILSGIDYTNMELTEKSRITRII